MDDKNKILPQSSDSNINPVSSTTLKSIYPEATSGITSSTPVVQSSENSTSNSSQISRQPFRKWQIVTLLAFILTITALVLFSGLKYFQNSANKQNNKSNQSATGSSENNTGGFDFNVYLPNNYNGAMELTYARALDKTTDADPNLIPRYELFYTAKTPSGQQANTIHVIIFKGSTNYFNPPENCGNGSPNSDIYKSTDTYPCKVVMKTKLGREILGYRSLSRLQHYKVAPNSEDVKKVQPEIFYIAFGETVVSFRDPAGLNYVSSLTPTVVEQFVDSLEPVDSDELAKFIDANKTPKSLR